MIAAAVCQLCAKGTYSTAQGVPAGSDCIACVGGTFSTGSGITLSSACAACAKGWYALSGSTVCLGCPINSNTASTGASAETDCVCDSGRFGNPFLPAGCGSCPSNYYCSPTNQTACPTGYFSLGGSTLSSDCKCQPNASFVAGGVGCTCLDGYSKEIVLVALNYLGDRRCIQCPADSFCKLDSTTACPANSKSALGSVLLADCKCDDGYYYDSGLCPECPTGSYCKGNIKSVCPDNTNSAARSSLQTHCACNAGFKCRRVRDVRLLVRFQLSRAQFDAQAASIKASLASIAGVDAGVVELTASVPVTTDPLASQRRLLGVPPDDPGLLEVSAHIAVQSGTDLTTVVT
jgi:hypothetical protein